jgi:phenylpropionate dioxygenase-like ring-hydroxylating dioxygenase large terminal subunit|tara:strand:- start:965 stop:2338 length:1374 start_codon:yes stop_codon:yes gene_type:complete
MGTEEKKLKPGEAREQGPSLRDELLRDPTPPPAPLLEESYEFLGDEDISFENYTSPDFAQAEYEKLWSKVWQWACHVDHIPQPGDYFVYDIGDLSALIVRTENREIKAYFNSCMHRGTQLKQPGTCGFSKELRCPFHGWTWSLEGQLVDLPQAWDFPHVTADSHQLPEMPVDIWEGFVFINFDQEAEPLNEYLGVLPRHWEDWGLSQRYIETHIRKHLPCNWKAAAEAFIEAYHVRETHATGQLGDEVTTQYDVFGENVSRFIHTRGLNSPLRSNPRTEDELLERISGRTLGEGDLTLPPGVRARDHYANHVQETMGERYGHDFSHLSESITLDSIEYYLFPNAFFFPGLSLPMVYRFRPDPTSPDFSYFDLLFMRPRPPEGEAPPPPEVIELGIDESYSTAEGVGPLGRVYDQDTANLAAQTRGFKSSFKNGQTLGNYQEIRVRHLQQRVKTYLEA